MKRLAILLLLAGCSGDGTPSTAAIDSLIDSMASAQCDWEFRCCTASEIKQLDGNKFMLSEQCTPYRALALQTELYLHRLAATEGRLIVDRLQANACLAQLQMRACNPAPGMPVSMDPMTIDACATVFVGKTRAGQECIYASECEKGSRCVGDTSAVGRGVCIPFQRVDDICNVDADCDPSVKNIYCAKGDFRCHVRGAAAAPCMYTTDANGKNPTLPLLFECDSTVHNLYCDAVSSTCRTLPQNGDPCLSPLPPGVSSACDPDPSLGLVCDRTSSSLGGTCRAPATVGQSCQTLSCAKGLYCDSSTLTYVCKVLPSLGQSCSSSGYRCADPYYCNTSAGSYVCDQPAAVGESCISPTRTCDTGAYCDSSGTGACQAKLDDGAPCNSSIQCLSASCGLSAAGSSGYTCLPRALVGVQCVGK